MAQNKKQHYVPKFFLRKFSDGTDIVYAYNLKHCETFRLNISDICQEKYFYGNEKEFEQNLGKIEGIQALILKKLIESLSIDSLDENELYYWFLFILMQFTRTKGSADLYKKSVGIFYNEKIKPILKESPELKQKGITPEFIDSTNLIIGQPLGYTLSVGMMGAELISDLFPIFLINNTDKPFLVSDDFICLYNYVKLKKYNTLGLQSPGLQIYCPLNQNIIFLLVDQEFYHIELNKNQNGTGIIYINKTSDIDAINKLQILNCDQNIIFSSQIYETYIKELHSEFKQLLGEKSIKHDQVFRKMPRNYRLQLSFIRLNREMYKNLKRRTKKAEKINPTVKHPKLYRDFEICKIVSERINKTYQEAREELNKEGKNPLELNSFFLLKSPYDFF
jgi:hypothetical protein